MVLMAIALRPDEAISRISRGNAAIVSGEQKVESGRENDEDLVAIGNALQRLGKELSKSGKRSFFVFLISAIAPPTSILLFGSALLWALRGFAPPYRRNDQ
jgi:hypothetical protein